MKYTSTLLSLITFLLFTNYKIFAQTATIKGVVSDAKGETIVGASVMLVGTNKGTATDLDGNYKIVDLKPGKVSLTFSSVGLKKQTQTIEITDLKEYVLNIKLEDDALLLQEAVVVGYGLEQKRDVTGAVATIKSKDINNTVQPSFDQAIQGRASGVQVTSSSGVAGAPVKIQIRGTNSITAGSSPLFVIDGVVMNNGDYSPGNTGTGSNPMGDINPNDIESMEVLKDAAACAIYGARGANGVILITTKKGKEGKTKFNFDYSYGIMQPTKKLEFLNAEEHLKLRDDAAKYSDTAFADKPSTLVGGSIRELKDGKMQLTNITRRMADSISDATGGQGYNWIDEVLQTGSLQNYNLSAAGGNDRTTFYISGGYRDEQSFLKGSRFKRLATKINIDNKANDYITLGTSIGITNSVTDRVPIGDAGGLGKAQQILPWVPIYNPNGSYNMGSGNPLWQIENWKNNANVWRILPNAYVDLKLTKHLQFRTNLGIDFLNQIETEYQAKDSLNPSSQAYAWDRRTNVNTITNSNYFTYQNTFRNIHSITFLLGNEVTKSRTTGIGVQGIGFANDGLTTPATALAYNQFQYQTGYGFLSYFSRLNYKLYDRLLLGMSFRYDGSSRFGNNNKWGTFPSFSAGYILSEEEWMKKLKFISFAKIRSSFGQTGNAEIGNFQSFGLYTSNPNGYNGNIALNPSQLANTNLGWEKANTIDVNLDLAFFKNRIALGVNYYNRQSQDLLMNKSFQTSSGFSGIITNVGSLKNEGFEFTLNTKNIEGKFTWTTDFNIAMNRNKAQNLDGLPPDAFESGQPGEGRVIENYPIGIAYVVRYAGVQKEDGFIKRYDAKGNALTGPNGESLNSFVKAGTDLYYDKNGNLMTWQNPTGNFYDNRVARGNPVPKFFGGITNSFTYKGFDLNFLFVFVQGNTIYDDPAKQQIGNWGNNGIAQRKEILEAYNRDNKDSDIPALITTDSLGKRLAYNAINSDRYLYDASYIRLRSLTIGYNFNELFCKKIKVANLRIYINGGNLLTFTKYPGWDPEVLRNVNTNSQQGNISFAGPSFQTPQARTIQVGVKIGF
jgi:TonB-dependent starch-binding outer membrane protein SusC